MLRNYFKIAWRNFRKQKLYSFINIFGLSVGIACCLLVYLFVQDELSFDAFHKDVSRIYRVQEVDYQSDEASHKQAPFFNTSAVEGVRKSAWLPLPLGPMMEETYPGVEHAVRYSDGSALLRNGKTVFEESLAFTDPDFLQVFSFKLLKGNSQTVLKEKHSIILTPALARKYFGAGDAMGQYLNIKIQDQEEVFTVTGIIKPAPSNSSIQYQAIVPIQNRPFYDDNLKRWNSFNTIHFAELAPGADPAQLQKKLNNFAGKRYKDSIERARTRYKMSAGAKVMAFTLTPMTAIHLDASVSGLDPSNPLYAYILSGIALLILLIACINYITLALTRSTSRAKEVGIRKAVGAYRKQVAIQFFGETMLLTVFALIAGIALAEILLPVFNELSGRELAINYIHNGPLLIGVSILTLLVGLIAGSYPALFLSKFNTTEVLKSQSSLRFRPHITKILLVFQYSLSVFLIISSVIMYRQLNYVSQKKLGYADEQVIAIPTYTGWTPQGAKLMQRYRAALATVPGVADVSGMSPAFTAGSNIYGFDVDGETKSTFIYYVDEHFLSTMGIDLVEGRNFKASRSDDKKNAIIVNQALVKSMGWKNPIGQQLPWKGEKNPSTVIGVVKNFHFQSLEAPIKPMLMHMDPEQGGVSDIMIKIKAGQISKTLPAMRTAWAQVAPFTPFDYWFLDDAVAHQYKSYRQWMSIMACSTVLAIIIACLGLFGLTGITAVNRTKEIGIRKVLGAGTRQMMVLFNKDILKLILLSLVLSAPASWYVMNRWLSDFTYRIKIGPGIFIISAFIAFAIALLATSYHTVKTAMTNPVDSLRSE